GYLLDRSGDDLYVAGARGVNGGGYAGAGSLIDLGGNDTYQASGFQAVNGGAQGDRGYLCADQRCVYYETPAVGLLLDGGGRDRYIDARGEAVDGGVSVPMGSYGIRLDLALP
ncbi:MAG TPA: hypothetical protein VNZ52_12430, partial [Candidatus Thermoplasmatota archaeon]|nr:hypothetical protein [Candidatus Thermoplasmatota archaeon]